jgi:hypothetical protein
MTIGTESVQNIESPEQPPAADQLAKRHDGYAALLRRQRQIRRRMFAGGAVIISALTAGLLTYAHYNSNVQQRQSDLRFLAAPDKFGTAKGMTITGPNQLAAALPIFGGDSPQVVITLQDCSEMHLKFGLTQAGTAQEALIGTVHQTDSMGGNTLRDMSYPVTIEDTAQLQAFEHEYVTCPPPSQPKGPAPAR